MNSNASCAYFYRYSTMGANESTEMEEHYKLKVDVKDASGTSKHCDEEIRRKYKYKGEITNIPKFELQAHAPAIAGAVKVGSSSCKSVAIRK